MDFWCWIRDGIAVVVRCNINVVVVMSQEKGLHSMGGEAEGGKRDYCKWERLKRPPPGVDLGCRWQNLFLA
jgi:hypothetical protein